MHSSSILDNQTAPFSSSNVKREASLPVSKRLQRRWHGWFLLTVMTFGEVGYLYTQFFNIRVPSWWRVFSEFYHAVFHSSLVKYFLGWLLLLLFFWAATVITKNNWLIKSECNSNFSLVPFSIFKKLIWLGDDYCCFGLQQWSPRTIGWLKVNAIRISVWFRVFYMKKIDEILITRIQSIKKYSLYSIYK